MALGLMIVGDKINLHEIIPAYILVIPVICGSEEHLPLQLLSNERHRNRLRGIGKLNKINDPHSHMI